MDIFECYTAKIKADSMAKGMRVKLVSTDASRLPAKTMAGLRELERTTQHNSRFTLNLCVSYGGRGEIINAARSIAEAATKGARCPRALARHPGTPMACVSSPVHLIG